MTSKISFIKEERLYNILAKVISKLNQDQGLEKIEISEILEITEDEATEFLMNKKEMN